MVLTPKQRAHLRSLAHHLKPIHSIGREGISELGLRAVSEAFGRRELLKVKVQQTAPVTAAEAGELLAAQLADVEHVQTIGRTVVLYRPDPESPRIVLPE